MDGGGVKRQDAKKAKVTFSDKEDVKVAGEAPAKPPVFKKAKGAWNRHDLLSFAAKAGFLLLLPAAYLQYGVMDRQAKAISEWPAAERCVLHEVYTQEVKVQKSMVTKTTEFRLKVRYSYRTPNHANLTSDNVFYYGAKHPSKSMRLTDRIADHMKQHGCRAVYNPDDETEVFLLPEAHYQPYLYALGGGILLLLIAWYIAMEHNWDAMPEPEARFDEAKGVAALPLDHTYVHGALPETSDTTWYHLVKLHGVRDWGETAVGLAVCVAWQLYGMLLLRMYTALPRYAGGAEEYFTASHVLGGALCLRWAYSLLLTARLRDVVVLIDTPQVTMGEPFTVIFQAPRRAQWMPVYFHQASLKFSLMESTYGPSGGRRASNRKTKVLHSDEVVFLENTAVPKGSAGLVQLIPFKEHICRLTPDSADGRETSWHRWAFDLKLSISFLPMSYDEQWPVTVFVPPEFRRRVGDDEH